MWADSSAALAIVKRSGAGKLRHINISLLRVQEQEKLKKLVYEKVPGQANPADLFAKGVGREKLQQFAWASVQTFLDGRAQTSLQVQGGSKVSTSAHAELMQMGSYTAAQIPWRKGQGGVVEWSLQLETMGGHSASVTTCAELVRAVSVIVKTRMHDYCLFVHCSSLY